MSIELKPCPFCGREAVLSSIHIGGGDYRALVTCTRIGLSDGCASVMVERSSKKTAELDAVKKWNTRAERTCRIEWENHSAWFRCDACETSSLVERDDSYLGYISTKPIFCPNCGAKVVK